MATETLLEKLNYNQAYRQTRLEAAQWVMNHPETFPKLIDYCFQIHTELSYRATWVLEFVCAEQLELLHPHLDQYFEKLPNVYQDQALRPLAKICEMIAVSYYKRKEPQLLTVLSEAHKKVMTTCCFDWLISNQKVACKVFAMTTLFYLGTEFEWIHPELKAVISENIHENSPAYRARGKDVLKKISKQ